MKASDYVKSKGVKSLKALSEYSGFHSATLIRWYQSEPAKAQKLDSIIALYIAAKGVR
tara:strand:+ start:340 stop:513 length:174 start_codon:yes stop_codon:yes gene_type:complete